MSRVVLSMARPGTPRAPGLAFVPDQTEGALCLGDICFSAGNRLRIRGLNKSVSTRLGQSTSIRGGPRHACGLFLRLNSTPDLRQVDSWLSHQPRLLEWDPEIDNAVIGGRCRNPRH